MSRLVVSPHSTQFLSDSSVGDCGYGSVTVDVLVVSSAGSHSWMKRRSPGVNCPMGIHWCLTSQLRPDENETAAAQRMLTEEFGAIITLGVARPIFLGNFQFSWTAEVGVVRCDNTAAYAVVLTSIEEQTLLSDAQPSHWLSNDLLMVPGRFHPALQRLLLEYRNRALYAQMKTAMQSGSEQFFQHAVHYAQLFDLPGPGLGVVSHHPQHGYIVKVRGVSIIFVSIQARA